MIFVTTLFITFGFVGYLCWGENVAGSLTLNLPQDEMYFVEQIFFSKLSNQFSFLQIGTSGEGHCFTGDVVNISAAILRSHSNNVAAN